MPTLFFSKMGITRILKLVNPHNKRDTPPSSLSGTPGRSPDSGKGS